MNEEKMKPWGFELEEYIREGEPDKAARADAWQIAIGLQAVDGLKPSRFLVETAKEHIEGNITIDEAQQRIEDYYKERVERTQTEWSLAEAPKGLAMNENNLSEIVLFESSDGAVSLDVQTDRETVWLSLNQISSLFDRDKSTISRHIKNVYEERELDESSTVALFATVQNEGDRTVEREVQYYNLDVIVSVGYRVKSQRGVEFRRWATNVLRRYIIDGRAENELRLQQLSQAVSLLERISDNLDTSQVLEIVKSYAPALDLLA